MRSVPGRRRGASGFTYVELLFVIGVIGVLAVFAASAIRNSIINYRGGSAVAKVLEDIRYAQQQARVKNGWFGVRFQINPVNQYNVYQTDGVTDTDVADPVNPASTLVINLMNDYNVAITAVDIGGGDKVEFDPMGTPYLDRTGAALGATGTITLSSGGANKVIHIFKNTGRVEAQ